MPDDKCRQQILASIAQLKKTLGEKTPPNERTTCIWVIEPLLEAAGYSRFDWIAEGTDATGNKPDYRVLPYSPHQWLVEAKAWNHTLSDADANQLTSYANTNHIRWAVLTNGQEWRLYDASIFGTVQERLMAQAGLDEPEVLANLLCALRKDAVQSDETERVARRLRMEREMRAQLCDENSPMVHTIAQQLGQRTKVEYTVQEVVQFFHKLIGCGNGPDLRWYPLDELARNARELAMGKKPALVQFPDGREERVSTWKELTIAVLQWFGDRLPPPPQPHTKGSKRCLYHEKPEHGRTPMISPYAISIAGRRLYVEMSVSSAETLAALAYLCECVGESPSGFRIAIGER
ncbi:MAG: type I restriction enzyme HsdR N-terminal domain-containing protein [Firmicutes bacterium]|nr:type I restriction enzyme HsdR N-terminal domain-containing protein [Bacillota bacterium]